MLAKHSPRDLHYSVIQTRMLIYTCPKTVYRLMLPVYIGMWKISVHLYCVCQSLVFNVINTVVTDIYIAIQFHHFDCGLTGLSPGIQFYKTILWSLIHIEKWWYIGYNSNVDQNPQVWIALEPQGSGVCPNYKLGSI
jgi:hypothetical protein